MLALLRQTPEGFPPFFLQGYENASAAGQATLGTATAYLLDRVNETPFRGVPRAPVHKDTY